MAGELEANKAIQRYNPQTVGAEKSRQMTGLKFKQVSREKLYKMSLNPFPSNQARKIVYNVFQNRYLHQENNVQG